MELNDFKEIWNKEKMEMEERITTNDRLIKELIINKSKGRFRKFLNISLLGRYLSLAYMLISIIFTITVINEYEFSIPAFFGAIAMLISFIQHVSLKKPDFSLLNTIELQKAIINYRIHTKRYSIFDMGFVAFWILTLMPVYIKLVFEINIYTDVKTFLIFIYFSVVFIIIICLISIVLYNKLNNRLKEDEDRLKQISEMEDN
ncbi:MAG: hypothetical protein ACQERS_14665 [Bacteroidota bacterium]